jgi:hypothetical protein
VILTALAKQPDARFASAGAMAQALQQAGATLPADQWRSLSARATAGGGIGPSTGRQAFLPTRPAGPAPTLEGTGRIGLVIGAVVIAAIAVAITLFAVTNGREPVVVGAAQPATSPGAAQPAASQDAAQPAASADATTTTPPVTALAGSAHPDREPAEVARPASGGPAEPVGPGRPAVRPRSPSARDAGTAHADAPGVARGSAADHGVIIGPNVVTGPNVIVGSGTPPTVAAPAAPTPGRASITRPADYNPRRFDPVAYLAKAQQLARELLPDARLTSFEFDPVFPDGHVDLTMDGRDRAYEFRSPARSAFPAGRPRNLPIERACRVTVEVGVRTITASVRTSDACDDRLVRAPRCSFASVWKQALAKGVPSDVVARIGWLFDESWFFDIDLAGNGGGVSSFADRCP